MLIRRLAISNSSRYANCPGGAMPDVALRSALAGWWPCADSLWCSGRWAALPDLAALNRHPPCAHIGKFAPDEIAENDQVEQKNQSDRNTPSDIPHGLIPCCTGTKVLLSWGGVNSEKARQIIAK
jgi:hypothetical protein